jgi:UDP-N-acetyl-D-mannosaminuronate dehydrogenase
VLVLGLAYRENVKESAFSGAIRLVRSLKERGATPLINDPLYKPKELSHYGAEPVSLEELPQFDAAILQAYHEAYKSLDWRRLAQVGCKAILDGRNSLDHEEIESAGMTYLGIGR